MVWPGCAANFLCGLWEVTPLSGFGTVGSGQNGQVEVVQVSPARSSWEHLGRALMGGEGVGLCYPLPREPGALRLLSAGSSPSAGEVVPLHAIC